MAEVNLAAIDAVLQNLNRAVTADATAIAALLAYRVPCNAALALDETIQVNSTPPAASDVGALGLICGMLGIGADGVAHICAVYDVVCVYCDETLGRHGRVGDACADCGSVLRLGPLLYFARTEPAAVPHG